jgi:hypothetical protein
LLAEYVHSDSGPLSPHNFHESVYHDVCNATGLVAPFLTLILHSQFSMPTHATAIVSALAMFTVSLGLVLRGVSHFAIQAKRHVISKLRPAHFVHASSGLPTWTMVVCHGSAVTTIDTEFEQEGLSHKTTLESGGTLDV